MGPELSVGMIGLGERKAADGFELLIDDFATGSTTRRLGEAFTELPCRSASRRAGVTHLRHSPVAGLGKVKDRGANDADGDLLAGYAKRYIESWPFTYTSAGHGEGRTRRARS